MFDSSGVRAVDFAVSSNMIVSTYFPHKILKDMWQSLYGYTTNQHDHVVDRQRCAS
jgi:hypothetical protein